MRVAANVEMLEIKGEQGTVYPVFIWDDNERILIDTGFPGQTKLFEEALMPIGFSLSDLTRIILTHQDLDHIGGIKDFTANSSAELLAYEDEAPYISGEKIPVKVANMEKNFEHLPPNMQAFFPSFKQAFESRRMKADMLLKDKEVLPYCSGIEIIHTPGHTPGHICVYLRESKTLITGDALNISDGKLVGANPQHTKDMELAHKSISKLINYSISSAVCYHGGLYQGNVNAAITELTEKV